MTPTEEIPSSILIIGSGVFGLSTAYSLTLDPRYAKTNITLLDRLPFPSIDGASIDTSRIVRGDYADIAYSRLAFAAQERWRNTWWGEGENYSEPGLAVMCSGNGQEQQSDGNPSNNGELGRNYVTKAMANVTALGLKPGKKSEGGEVEEILSKDDIKNIFDEGSKGKNGENIINGTGGGDYGYVNWRSGWSNAESAMRTLRKKAEDTKRISFIHGTVQHLVFTDSAVTGVVVDLADAVDHKKTSRTTLTAETIVLATGAWTPALIDTRGICSATGQVLAYIPITDDEQAFLHNNPTVLNQNSGMFILPPRNNILKIARHAYGYANPTSIPHPEQKHNNPNPENITVSLPRTAVTHPDLEIPLEGLKACESFLHNLLPSFAGRKFTRTRICWYTDTWTSDFILTYHPKYKNLFVATGGSGHAFKFLPVIGDEIVKCISGQTPQEFKDKWKWPERRLEHHGHVWTRDCRGGLKGMVLDDELRKGESLSS